MDIKDISIQLSRLVNFGVSNKQKPFSILQSTSNCKPYLDLLPRNEKKKSIKSTDNENLFLPWAEKNWDRSITLFGVFCEQLSSVYLNDAKPAKSYEEKLNNKNKT